MSGAGSSNGTPRDLNEEISNWKENSVLLYDSLITHVLEWPSLSVQFLPNLKNQGTVTLAEYSSNGEAPKALGRTREDDLDAEADAEELCEIKQSILLGTHTSKGETNSVLLVDVLLPKGPVNEHRVFASHTDYSGFKFGKNETKFSVRYRIPHVLGEPNRVRASPHSADIIATISVGGAVTVFDVRSARSRDAGGCAEQKGAPDPSRLDTLSLVGHDSEGWGLGWSPLREGWLVSGADDKKVCVWDTQICPLGEKSQGNTHGLTGAIANGAGGGSSGCIVPVQTLPERHSAAVQDVVWHPSHASLVLSVGDDGRYIVWDLRQGDAAYVSRQLPCEEKALNAIAVNPVRCSLFATGGAEKDIVLWDMRNYKEPLYKISGHESTISRIDWGPSSERYLTSCGADRFVMVWDLYSIGREMSAEEATDGPPELLFTHAGHTGIVHDFAWNPNDGFETTLASVSDDNQLHIWTMGDTLFDEDHGISDNDSDDSFQVE